MAIRFDCSSCHFPLTVGEEFQGTELHCPKCGRAMFVPGVEPTDLSQSVQRIEDVSPPPHITGRRPFQPNLNAEDEEDRPIRKRKRSVLRWILAGVAVVLGLIVLAIIIIVSAAGANMKAAKDTVANYFQANSKKDANKVLSLYSPEFYLKTPKEQWQKIQSHLQEKLGDYQSHNLLTWRYQTGTGGNHIMLVYQVHYVKGEASETFSFLDRGGAEPLLIFGHQINSPALLGPNK